MKKNRKPESQSAAFVSLGCFKNTVDSEVLAGMLQGRGAWRSSPNTRIPTGW